MEQRLTGNGRMQESIGDGHDKTRPWLFLRTAGTKHEGRWFSVYPLFPCLAQLIHNGAVGSNARRFT